MARKYFGTDGIRGRANGLITPELALKVGQAAGLVFQRGEHRHRVVIGKDTRLSGYMIENAMVAGFTSVGMPAAIRRFTALHAYDNVRDERLPAELRNANPGGVQRLVDGAWTMADIT